MLKKFKKSEIAIYAISLMLVAAGYFNYSTFNQKTEETYSEDVGNISEQYANVGDAVKKGQVILILEAMKMENEVVAPEDGTVASIDVASGATVEAGDTLATLN